MALHNHARNAHVLEVTVSEVTVNLPWRHCVLVLIRYAVPCPGQDSSIPCFAAFLTLLVHLVVIL